MSALKELLLSTQPSAPPLGRKIRREGCTRGPAGSSSRVLGLPDHVTACLFDLDGVLTQTAMVHAAAWKQTFDAFLRARRAAGEPFDVARRLRALRRRQAASGRRALVPAVARDHAPGGHADDPPDAETVHGLGNRKNDLVNRSCERQGVERTRARCATCAPRATPACSTAVVSSSSNTQEVLARRASRTCSRRGSTASSRSSEHLAGKPAPDTFLAGARALGVEPAHAAVFEDALAGVEAGPRGRFGCVVGVDRARQADALRSTAPTSSSTTSPSCWSGMIAHPALRGRPVGGRARPSSTSTLLAQTESVFALSNGHIGLRGNLDEGEPARRARHVPQRVLRELPAAVRRGAATATPRTARRSSTSPTARSSGCSSTTSRSTSATASCARTSACSTCATACCAASVEWRSPAGQRVRVTLDAARVVRAPRDRRDRVRGRAARRRRARSSSSRSWSRTSRSRSRPATRAPPRRSRAPLEAEQHGAPRAAARRSVHRTRRSGLRLAAAMDHVVDGPGGHRHRRSRVEPDLARVTVTHASSSPARRCGS